MSSEEQPDDESGSTVSDNFQTQVEEANIVKTVVQSVAATKNVDPNGLPPLYDSLDPDALTSLWQSRSSTAGGDPLSISFIYSGCQVVLSNDTITVKK
jgi:hypothetical protein